MSYVFDVVLQGGTCVLPNSVTITNIGVQNGKITSLSPDLGKAKKIISCHNLVVFPGAIDSQVHFREPGLTHKEDFETGSKAAILGGVTSFLDMPNTKPPTTSVQTIKEKVALAKGRSYANFGFLIGATSDNLNELVQAENTSGCVGIKIFLGSSTGNLLLNDPTVLANIFRETRLPIAFHSEDEQRLREREHIRQASNDPRQHSIWRDVETAYRSTRMILELARKHQRRIHLLHISSKEEIELLHQYRDVATVEVLPQHLTLHSPDCYQRLGTYAQMNPPIREIEHQEALWRGLNLGIVDIIGSDHAPHTKQEKDQGHPHAPSGMPGVQTIFPLMLHHSLEGKLSWSQLSKLLSENPANLYNLKNKGKIAIGLDADFIVADVKGKTTIRNADMASKCGHTPFDGMELRGQIRMTICKGQIVMEDGHILGKPTGESLT